jgi:hypothetical protein
MLGQTLTLKSTRISCIFALVVGQVACWDVLCKEKPMSTYIPALNLNQPYTVALCLAASMPWHAASCSYKWVIPSSL